MRTAKPRRAACREIRHSRWRSIPGRENAPGHRRRHNESRVPTGGRRPGATAPCRPPFRAAAPWSTHSPDSTGPTRRNRLPRHPSQWQRVRWPRRPDSAGSSPGYHTGVPTLRADENDLRQTGAYYDAFAEVAEERYTSNHVLVRVREAFRRAVESYPADSVLDLGCGPGTDLAWFAERYPARRYAGIDVSPRMVELASAKLAHSGTRVARGCVEDLPRLFPDEQFDLVYSFFGPLNTEPDLEHAVQALSNVVRPGGVLVLTFVNRTYIADSMIDLLKGRPRRAVARLSNRWGRYSQPPLRPSLFFPRQIRALFAPAFQVEAREGFSILYPAWY